MNMTTEEAIKYFEAQAQSNCALIREAAEMAVAALRAQQCDAKSVAKPIYKNRPERYDEYYRTGETQDGEPLYRRERKLFEKNPVAYCGACGKRLCSRFMNFCPACGAKVEEYMPTLEHTENSRMPKQIETVHCGDCKHLYFKDFEAYCPHRAGPCRPSGSCEHGERPEEA